MIAKALEYLTNLGRKDVAPFSVVKDNPRAESYLISGALIEVEKPVPPRDHELESLNDLIAMTENFDDAVVFYTAESVVLILDYSGHRVEKSTFTLTQSDQWATVKKLGPWMEPKALIRLLRTDLYGCLPDAQLVDLIRRIRFENGQTVTADTQRARESLGREIISKVSTAVEIPDRVTLCVPVYSSLGETERYPLQGSVEIEPTRLDAFQLKPLPDEIERVQQLAVASIGERLRAGLDKGIPCYYGSS